MARYGSASANLSPLLFKGNRNSIGVNIIIHNDVSNSMNLPPNGWTNYQVSRPALSGQPNISAASTISMFYDGFFVEKLQNYLLFKKIGDKSTTQPNLYAYFDTNTRIGPTFSVTNNSSTLNISNTFIKGDSTGTATRSTWRNNYINVGGPYNTNSEAEYLNRASTLTTGGTNRFVGISGNQISEDVHGNLWSLSYFGSTSNTISSGESGIIGKVLKDRTRRGLPTFVITASNEQENAPPNMLGVPVETKLNVGYTTDRELYSKPGLHGVRFDHYFDDDGSGSVYIAAPSGTQSQYNSGAGTGEIENWFSNIAQFLPEGPLAGNRDENIGIGSTTSIRIENFPLQEDDIEDYSFMWIGYFKPNVSGNWKFRTNSNEKSLLWIDSDTDITNNTVYTVSGWKYSNAKVQNTASRTENQLIDLTSADVPLTAGRYYPIRIIFGNRPGGTQQGTSPTNISRITVTYDPPGGSPPISNQTTDGTNLLFGADDVWKTGSEFFPPKIVDVTKTLEQEVIDRSYRIISLSSYKQPVGDPDYDGVFFNKDGTYRYITLQSGGNYTQQPSLIAPNWSLGNYYNKVGFAISSTHVNNTGATGTGVSVSVDKYNSYYISTVNPLQKGSGYRIGDRISIAGTSLAESTPANDLVLEVTQVEPAIYSDQLSLNPTNVRNNYTVPTPPTAPTSARFTVKKNFNNTFAYTIAMPNGGTGYSQNDRLKIPGSSLDGTAGVNDLDILVGTVDGSGTILTYSIGYLGVGAPNPTNYIDYTIAPSYKPISVTGVAYSTTGIASVGYTTSLIAGIAFTTANISGIAYTTASVVSIAFTSKTITNISYPSQKGAIINKVAGPGTLVIVDTTGPHGLVTNDFVTIDASGDANLDNLTFQITRINLTSFSLNGTTSFNANISDQTILYIESNPTSTDLARVECTGHGLNNGDIIDISGSSNLLFNNRFTITTFGDPDNFDLRGTATSPYYESDFPVSSDGTATLKADATLTISASNTAYTTGSSVRVQSSDPVTFNDTDFTIRQYTSTTYRLEGSSSGVYGSLTNTTGGIVGLNNAPATVTTSSAHSFVTGQNVAIQNSSASFNGNYTISVYTSTKFGLNGKINPADYTVTTNTGIAGLRDSPPIFTTKLNHPFATGDSVRLQDCTNTFFNNQDYTITVYGPTSFGASNVSVQNPTNFATAVVTTTPTQNNGLLGLRNSNVNVDTTVNHNYVAGQLINIYGTTSTNAFSGNRTIASIISPTRFTLVSTANTTDYRSRAIGGKASISNLGAIVTTSTNHTLTGGETVNITGLLNPSLVSSEFNGSRTVQSIISPTRFSLSGTSGTSNYDNTASPGTLGSSLAITGGAGSSAQLVIRRRIDGVYQVSAVSIPGSGYDVNDQLIVTGINLGGATGTNDATITVTAVTQNTDTLSPNYDVTPGKIVSASVTGVSDIELDYSDNTGALRQFIPTVVPGSGSGAQWIVERNGTTTYVVSRTNGGSNYYVNDKILIRGNNLGGNTTANDLLIRVTSVNASGVILSTSGFTFSGTAALGAPISVTGLTTVTTATQFSRPYNLEVDGGSLDQRHPTLELAELTKGGLFKIDRVYVALANSLTVGNVDTIAGISSVDRRESFAAALADFINTNR